MKAKYITLLVIIISFIACNDPEDVLADYNIDTNTETENLPALTSGEANFSTYVALGNSLTAGFSDGALFKASQENSYPNIMADVFSLISGGTFTQPLMNDNFGGLALNGTRIADPRLVFDGAGLVPLESVLGPVTVTTDIVLNNPTGPFNNLGVPGARSFHLLANGYGNIANFPAAANPYFVRMTGATPNASVLELAMAQSPTFFSLWIGNNDVLGYATSGGDGSSSITDQPTFDFAITTLVSTLTSGGAKGVIANIPNVTDIPHFTTVPYNPVPLDAATAGALNQGYAAYNGGIQQALAALDGTGLFTAEEAALRTISFSESANNAMVIVDESLTDLGAINPAFAALPKYRQATEDDLFVLPLLSLIPQGYGTQIPLEDKWVLIPMEQEEIETAVNAFNSTIKSAANSAGLAFVDANAILNELAINGISSGNLTLTSDLLFGGAFSLDGVHLTSRGYALAANEFLKAIDAKYNTNFEASGNLVDIGDYPTNYSPLLQ